MQRNIRKHLKALTFLSKVYLVFIRYTMKIIKIISFPILMVLYTYLFCHTHAYSHQKSHQLTLIHLFLYQGQTLISYHIILIHFFLILLSQIDQSLSSIGSTLYIVHLSKYLIEIMLLVKWVGRHAHHLSTLFPQTHQEVDLPHNTGRNDDKNFLPLGNDKSLLAPAQTFLHLLQ